MNFFKELSTKTTFPVCYNLLPHYAAEGQQPDSLMDCVKAALQDGRITSFFLSDQPLHPQKISTLEFAQYILAEGGEPIISLALNFNHRKTVKEKLQKYYQAGVRHFFFVSGNFPAATENRQAEPVFDIDSVQMLMLLDQLDVSKNTGNFNKSQDGPAEVANIIKGCAVSPFKKLESEQIWQYEKLKRKIAVGADFIITQPGFDMRKFDELVRFCSLKNITVPLVANILVMDGETAQFVQSQKIPGVKIPDQLLNTLVEEARASNNSERTNLIRTAKTFAVLKGLGYNGVLIGGTSPGFSNVKNIMDEAEKLQTNWQNFPQELNCSGSSFYYFQKNPETGMNTDEITPLKPKHFPSPIYSFSYFIDAMIYLPKGPFFKMTGRICHFCNDRRFWYSAIWLLEFLSKGLLYGCKMCGDCVLYACGFRCYQSECPKKMENGPCGGSVNGFCEVFPDKKLCFWVRVYKQLKGVSQHITFTANPIPPRDNTLYKTSSWVNFFLGRDHRKMHFKDN